MVDAHDSKSCIERCKGSSPFSGTMNENRLLRLLIIGSIILLFFTALGFNKSYTLFRWDIFGLSALLVAYSLTSKRYYWSVTFLVFALLFNPWFHPSFTREVWVILDIVLLASLIFFALDYFMNYRKGLLFERYVQEKFPDSNYAFVSATKDLHKKFKRFVETDGDPDFVFRERATGKTFAIECKYRSYWAKGSRGGAGIWWNKETGARYERYSQSKGIPVYVALGIGGNPKAPEAVSFIPLEIIQQHYYVFIPEGIIKKYQKIPVN